MIKFTDDNGDIINVREEETRVVSTNGNQTVYAFTNPGGRTMMSVRYNEGGNNYADGMDSDGELPYDDVGEGLEEQVTGDNLNYLEDTHSNPGNLFTWKNLRLQSAIDGETFAKGRIGRAVSALPKAGDSLKRFLQREIPAKKSVRDSGNIMMMASNEDWTSYVMQLPGSPIDMGAELSAAVTPSQQLSVAKFIAEWERDPGQATLRKRALPGADVNELIAKGTLVYSFMTGRGPNPASAKGYGTFQYDKMFRLAFDIISTLPIYAYNSYTLFKMLDDEGEDAYREAVDTYVALESPEVAMVLEIRDKLAEIGPGYANMVINDVGAATEGGILMQKAVTAYNKGDTNRVRSILGYLQDSPFYYASPAGGAKNVFDGKNEETIFALRMESKKAKGGLEKYVRNGLIYISAPGFNQDSVNADGKWVDFKNKGSGKSFTVHKGVFDDTSVGIIAFGNSKDKFSFTPGAVMPKHANNKQRREHATELAEAIASNPGPKGRGKVYYVQIHPKTQLKMTRRPTTSSGTGDQRHGKTPKKGQNYWTKGLFSVVEKTIKADNETYKRDYQKKGKRKGSKGVKFIPGVAPMVKSGTLKSTGEEAPYYIKLPKHLFRVVTHPDYGYKTIMPKKAKANKEFVTAYTKFLEYYGMPKLSSTKDTHFRFIIPKAERGTYYDEVRRKVGDAKKRSR